MDATAATASHTDTTPIVTEATFAAIDTAAWDALVPAGITPYPFVSRAWAEPWWDVCGGGNELLLLAVHTPDGVLVAVAPLMIAPTDDLGRAVRFLGGVDVTDYLDLAVRPDDAARAWAAILDWLLARRERWDALDFHCLPDASPSHALIADALAAADATLAVVVAQEEVCPAVPLRGGFEAYLAAIGKKYRNEIRRKERNLLRDAPTMTLRVVRERAEAVALLPEFFRLHRLSAPDKERFLTPPVEEFFRRITTSTADAGSLALYVLDSDGTPAAMMYAFLAADRLLVYNSGFDPTRSETSVGMVLTGMMIAHAAEAGVAVCDFLRGNEAYKYRFGATDTPLWRVIAGADRATAEGVAAAMTAALAIPADARDQE